MNKTFLAVVALLVATAYISTPVSASVFDDIAISLNVFAQGLLEMVNQNDVIIQQNYEIITLLKGDRSIFVAGMTERYDLVTYIDYGSCEYFDRLDQTLKTGTCPTKGLTKDQFNSLITGQPER